jgi:hypothetical protein
VEDFILPLNKIKKVEEGKIFIHFYR